MFLIDARVQQLSPQRQPRIYIEQRCHRTLLAKAALAATELEDYVLHVVSCDLRPQFVDEDQLGVRDLEQQKVANAQLTRRANKNVRVWQTAVTATQARNLISDH